MKTTGSDGQHPRVACARLAARQHGVFSLDQARANGLSTAAVSRLCRARELNGTLALAHLNADLEARLQELRVHSLFQIFDSVPAALEGLVGAGSEAVAALAA